MKEKKLPWILLRIHLQKYSTVTDDLKRLEIVRKQNNTMYLFSITNLLTPMSKSLISFHTYIELSPFYPLGKRNLTSPFSQKWSVNLLSLSFHNLPPSYESYLHWHLPVFHDFFLFNSSFL